MVREHALWLAPAVALLAMVVGLSLGAGVVSGQIGTGPPNAIVNPDFEENAFGWFSQGGTLAFSAARNSPGSPGGAIGVTNDLPYDYANSAYAFQCHDEIPLGRWLLVRGSVFVPSGQPRFTNAFIGVQGFTGPDCSGDGSQGGNSAGPVTAVDEWTAASKLVQLLPSAQSWAVVLATGKAAPGAGVDPASPVVAYFDAVYVGPPFQLIVPVLASD
jgi:hypothetical protein